MPVDQLFLCLLHHFYRQHRRTGTKVIGRHFYLITSKQNSRIKAAKDLAAGSCGFIVIEVPALQQFSPSGWLFL
jgi:hypothetical protein